MIKTVFIGWISATFFNQTGCDRSDNILIWEQDRKVQWGDFKGSKQNNSKNIAEVYVQLRLYYWVTEALQEFDVVCYVDKDRSWSHDTSAYGLQHEQGHFDIGEIFARKLRKAIVTNKRSINRSTVPKLDSLFHVYDSLCNEEQDLYDRQTSYSRNNTIQNHWNKNIASELKLLRSYERRPGDMRWKKKIKSTKKKR